MTSNKKYIFTTLILLIGLLLAITLSIMTGRYLLPPSQILDIILNGKEAAAMNIDASVVWNLRIPRILLNILVGGGLAIAGTVFQGIFRNPLVSPDILGVSSGAAFGAALGILISGINMHATAFALVFGIISVCLTYSLARLRNEITPLSLVLSGMIISAIFSALISLTKYIADPYDKLPAITYWLMGIFTTASYENVSLISIPILFGCFVLYMLRWKINILSLGDEEAISLGVNPARLRITIIAMATLITASCVTITGVIGWIGLVIPHICRMLVGVDHQRLLPISIIIGSIFMIIVDLIARTAIAAEIPVGIITALVGAPFFAILFYRTRGSWK